MAFAETVATGVSLLHDCVALIGTEVALLFAAGLVYVLCIRGLALHKPSKGNLLHPVQKNLPSTDRTLRDLRCRADHQGVVRLWQHSTQSGSPWVSDLSPVVDSMAKVGFSSKKIVQEVKLALDVQPSLLQAVVALASVLSRNRSNADVLEGVMALIGEAESLDEVLLAEIMELHLRRQDYQAVSETAARIPGQWTSKVRVTLATAAAQSGNLSESLDHLRLLQSLDKGHPCPLSSSTVVTILGLAVEEELLASAATELARLQPALDSKHVDSLVHAVAQKGGPQMIRDLIDVCDALSKDSSVAGRQTAAERHASSIVRGLAREGDLNSAVDFFKKLKMGGRAVSPLLYNCLLEAFVAHGDTDGALRHFEEMQRVDCLDVVSYNTLLKAHLNAGRLDDAEKLTVEMSSRGVRANRVTFNELLHARVLAKDMHGAWKVLDHMKSANIAVNAVTCSILLKGLTAHTHQFDVKRVFDLVLETEVDDALLSAAVEACNRLKHMEPLSQLLNRLPCMSSNVSAPIFGAMIKSFGQMGDVDRVRELWNQMTARGLQPGPVTFGCMAEALVMNGQPDEALELIHSHADSEETRPCINTVTYTTVLKGFAMAKRAKEVFSTYEEMKQRGIDLNTVTFNTMLDACAKCNAMHRASSLVEEMRKSAVELDIITYSTLVKGYCCVGDVDRALRVVEEMKSLESFAPDEIMYNSLLDGCAKKQNVDEGLRLLDEMRAARIAPSNYTLSIMVKLLGNARRLDQASQLVEDLSSQNGFRPNVQVYTCLTQACVMNRRLDRALQLHDRMVADSKCAIDEKFYSVLVRGCIQLRQLLTAVDVVRASYHLPGGALSSRPRPVGTEPRTLEELVRKLKNSGQEEQNALSRLAADLGLRGIDLYNVTATQERGSAGKGHSRGH